MKYLPTLILLVICSYYSSAQKLASKNAPDVEIVYQCAPCGCADDDQYFEKMGQCPSCNMTLNPIIKGLTLETQDRKRPIVGIFLFNMADVMDVSGPLSVFEHAGFNILTFSKNLDPVRIGMNLEIKPEYSFENLPKVDVMVLPGGGMAEQNPRDSALIKLIHNHYDDTEVFFSVCSGAFFLGEAGLLDHQEATTFASMIPLLAENYPQAQVLNNVKYTDNGKVVTSAGLSSGIDAAFQVVSKYLGTGRAQDIANHMEYPWKRAQDYARSQLADNFLIGIKNIISLVSTDYLYSQGDHNEWEYRYKLTEQISIAKIKKLIENELSKDLNWKLKHTDKLTILGLTDHYTLGKGTITLQFQEDSSDGAIVSIKAQRYKSYR